MGSYEYMHNFMAIVYIRYQFHEIPANKLGLWMDTFIDIKAIKG